MSRINIEYQAQTAIEDGLDPSDIVHATYLQAIALDRIATAIERIGMNDAVGDGPGALEFIGMNLQEIAQKIE